jgi:hypothetical protein
LIVNADTVLTSPFSSQRFQHISRRLAEIVQPGSRIHAVEFPPGYAFYAAPPPVGPPLSQFRSVVVFETAYHDNMVYCLAFNVKQFVLFRRVIPCVVTLLHCSIDRSPGLLES